MAENPCPKLFGDHRMVQQGQAPRITDYNGNIVTEFKAGNFYKCSGCGEYMITSGSPHFGPGFYLGDYVTQGGIYDGKSMNGVWVFRIDPNAIRVARSTSIPGYYFVGRS